MLAVHMFLIPGNLFPNNTYLLYRRLVNVNPPFYVDLALGEGAWIAREFAIGDCGWTQRSRTLLWLPQPKLEKCPQVH